MVQAKAPLRCAAAGYRCVCPFAVCTWLVFGLRREGEVIIIYLHVAESQAVGQRLQDQIRYLHTLCGPTTFQVNQVQLENYIIQLIHSILCWAISGALHQNRLQWDPLLTKLFDLLLRLRQATTEQTSSLPLIRSEDLKIVYETPPFDILSQKQSIEVWLLSFNIVKRFLPDHNHIVAECSLYTRIRRSTHAPTINSHYSRSI